MEFLWALLCFSLPIGFFGVICGLLTRRITKGGKFGRAIDVEIGATIGVLLGSLIGLIAVLMGVEEFFPFKMKPIGLVMPLVTVTVSSLVLLFLVKTLAKKRRSIEGTELHSK